MNKMFLASSVVVLILLCGLSPARALGQEQEAQEPTVQTLDPEAQESFTRGLRLYRNRNFREAMSEFSRVSESQPDRADVHYLIGYCHLMLKEFGPSVDAFHRSFDKDPEFDPRMIYKNRK